MKFRYLTWTLLLQMILPAVGEEEEINILFMGNSFTFRHDLPNLVKTVFEEGQPGLTVNVEGIVYGGQDMFRHHDLYFSESSVRLGSITVSEIEEQIPRIKLLSEKKTAPDFYKAYWEKTGLTPVPWSRVQKNLLSAVKRQGDLIEQIESGDRVEWDYLVLQSWRDVVAAPDAGYAEYVKKWASIAEKEGIKVVLYITAPRAQNAEPVSSPVEPEHYLMEMKAIRQLAETIKPHAVVPVPLGIKNIQEGGTDLTFRYVNDGHPNQYCAFLTANMFYAAFFKKSPEGFQFNTVVETNPKGKGEGRDPDGGEAKVVFDDTTKTFLQKAAYEAVMEFDAP